MGQKMQKFEYTTAQTKTLRNT